jgi:hypothetical protein
MTDMNETTPYIILPEQPTDQQKPTSLLEKQTEAPKMVITPLRHEEEVVGGNADTAGGTTITSGGDDKPEVTSGVLKRETTSPAAGSGGDELPASVEKVEKLEVKSADNNDEQDFK